MHGRLVQFVLLCSVFKVRVAALGNSGCSGLAYWHPWGTNSLRVGWDYIHTLNELYEKGSKRIKTHNFRCPFAEAASHMLALNVT